MFGTEQIQYKKVLDTKTIGYTFDVKSYKTHYKHRVLLFDETEMTTYSTHIIDRIDGIGQIGIMKRSKPVMQHSAK